MIKKLFQNTAGASLLLTIIILSVIIGAAAGVASIFSREIRLSVFVDDSIFAIMAADAGIEKKLYDIRQLEGDINTIYEGTLSNGATYITCPFSGACFEGDPSRIISEGEFGDTQRSLEVTY